MLTTQFLMRADPAFLAMVDDWRGSRRPIPTRSEAMRVLVRMGIEADKSPPASQATSAAASPKKRAAATLPAPDVVDIEELIATAPATIVAPPSLTEPPRPDVRTKARKIKTPPAAKQGAKRKPGKPTPAAIERGKLRKAITAHPSWKDYKAEHDNLKIEKQSTIDCREICAALGIDVAKILT